MIKHIFTLVWNKKKQNFLLFMEVFLAFFILFAVYTFVIQNVRNYQTPLGFDTKNIWQVDIEFPETIDSAIVANQKKRLLAELKAHPQIEATSFAGYSLPYNGSMSVTTNDDNGFDLRTHLIRTDKNYAEAAGLNIIEGRFFNEDDRFAKESPIVISKSLKEMYFPDKNVIDSVYRLAGQPRKIVGIVDYYKYFGAFDPAYNITILREEETDRNAPNLILRLKEGTTERIEAEINEIIASILKRRDFSIHYVENRRIRNERETIIPMVGLLAISGFLVINIALGLFGVLFYNINKRRPEIGLRRAVGATKGLISGQFVGEVFAVAFLGVVLGIIFAVQVPIFVGEEITEPINFYLAILAASLTIFILVIGCAFFPSKQATKIHPAIALHEE